MKTDLIFSGIGGQGTILLGKLMCGAAFKKGLTVTLAPAYGQEKRGGRASCQVVISEKIGSPVISFADTVLVMDEDSYKDYVGSVKPNGFLIVNSSMVSVENVRDDITVIELPVSDLARDLGNMKASNMIALGAVCKTLDIVTLDEVKEELKAKMKPALLEGNMKALEVGYNYF